MNETTKLKAILSAMYQLNTTCSETNDAIANVLSEIAFEMLSSCDDETIEETFSAIVDEYRTELEDDSAKVKAFFKTISVL